MVATENPLKTDTFKKQLKFLNESQWWSRKQLEDYQLKELRNLLTYCNKYIPYYRDLFKKANIDLAKFKKIVDIKQIPLLTKSDIQKCYDKFIPESEDINKLGHRSTGGSTGTPLTVYHNLEFLSKDKANTVYYMGMAGYNPFDFRSLRIYGDKIPEEIISRGEFWYERENKLIMSCYHYSSDTLPKYVEKINEYKPDYIHSRPSAILPLAIHLRDNNLKLKVKLGAIFLDGEILTNSQRDMVEMVFETKVFNIYGHTEGCAVAIYCEKSNLLHVLPQVGIFELLDKNGNEVAGEDEKGEIVVTGFNNKVFPLIRYRTFDVGINTNGKCECGRNFKLLKEIEGRIQDFVVNSLGRLIPLSPAVFNYNDMDWKGIKQFKVYQDKIGELLMRIVRERNIRETEDEMKNRVMIAFNKIFNNTFNIKIDFVNDIPRSKIGKFRYLDQKLDINQFSLSK